MPDPAPEQPPSPLERARRERDELIQRAQNGDARAEAALARKNEEIQALLKDGANYGIAGSQP